MALKYHLVKRRDMWKGATEGSKLFYGQVRANGRLTFDMLCNEISRVSTASRCDVQLVIASMIESMSQHTPKPPNQATTLKPSPVLSLRANTSAK